jgi:hypothetical protein
MDLVQTKQNICAQREINEETSMHRCLLAMTFLTDHMKSITLATGAAGIWIAQTVTDAFNRAKDLGSWGTTSILALICLVLAWWVYKLENEKKAEQEKREKKEEQRELKEEEKDLKILAVIDRNSDAMENMERQSARQTQHFEGIAKTLIQKGLDASQIPHARRDPPTKRSNP